MAKKRYRKASEIGEFVYCHKAWWLHHIGGNDPVNQKVLAAGRVQHAQHGARVQRATLLRNVALVVVVIGALLLIGGVLGWL